MSSFWRVGIVFLTFAAHILVFLTAREDFYMLLGLFTGAFWLYLLIIDEYDITDVFYMAIALRVFWLFSTPTLSDDYHRFLWDGEVTLSGKNVYGHTPSDLIVLGEFDTSLNGDLYKQMNSPDYFSVYPPVNQLYFI
ncbi:MAG: alpha-1,6-mannosyltransferase, partial [Flavobacteriales bacterium]